MESRVEAFPAGTAHLDTVRALHQTVVSLRTALEVSKNELKELRQKYQQHSQADYTDIIEKLALENHILRRKIIDSNDNDNPNIDQNIKLEVTYSPRSLWESDQKSSCIVTKTDIISKVIEEKESVKVSLDEKDQLGYETEISGGHKFFTVNESNLDFIETLQELDSITSHDSKLSASEVQSQIDDPQSEIVFSKEESSQSNHGNFKTKLELLSKFDVRIKVRTIDEGTITPSTTSEANSSGEERPKTSEKSKERHTFAQESKKHIEQTADNIKIESISSENIKMAVPNEAEVKSKNDKFNVQVRITSEENLVVKEVYEKSRRKDTLNLDVDDLSFR